MEPQKGMFLLLRHVAYLFVNVVMVVCVLFVFVIVPLLLTDFYHPTVLSSALTRFII